MYINGELVDSIAVFPSQDNRIHIDAFRQQLLLRQRMRLEIEEHVPVFALEGVPSRANGGFVSLKESIDPFRMGNPLFPPRKKNKE